MYLSSYHFIILFTFCFILLMGIWRFKGIHSDASTVTDRFLFSRKNVQEGSCSCVGSLQGRSWGCCRGLIFWFSFSSLVFWWPPSLFSSALFLLFTYRCTTPSHNTTLYNLRTISRMHALDLFGTAMRHRHDTPHIRTLSTVFADHFFKSRFNMKVAPWF